MSETATEAEQLIGDWKNAIEGDSSKRPEIVSESFVWKTPPAPGGKVRGPDDAKEVVSEVTRAFPDFEAEFTDTLTSEDKGMAEVRFEMAHEDEYGGIPATGREVELQVTSKWYVEDGKYRNSGITQIFRNSSNNSASRKDNPRTNLRQLYPLYTVRDSCQLKD